MIPELLDLLDLNRVEWRGSKTANASSEQQLAGAVDHAHVLRGGLVANLLRLERLRADLRQRAIEVPGLLRAAAVADRSQGVGQHLVPHLAPRQLAVVAAATGELDAAANHAEAHRLQRLENVLSAAPTALVDRVEVAQFVRRERGVDQVLDRLPTRGTPSSERSSRASLSRA